MLAQRELDRNGQPFASTLRNGDVDWWSERIRGRVLLCAGAAIGVALAVRGVIQSSRGSRALPPDAVALVGDSMVTRDEYDRAVAVAVEDRAGGEALGDARVRREVLDRLVDERLLVQAALEMGLPARDLRLREQVASAMSDTVTGEATAAPSDETLRAWEAAHEASFTRGGRLRIEAVFFHGKGAADRADEARARLLVRQPLAAAQELADAPPSPAPREPTAVAELAQSLGPSVAKAVDTLAPGEVTEPIPAGDDLWVVRLGAREGGELAPLADVRSAVLAGWRTEERERRLRRWLEQRRNETRVVVSETLR